MNPLRGRPPGEERERRRLEREQELGHGPRDVRVHDRDPLGSPLEEAAAIIASEQWRNPAGPIESVVSRAADAYARRNREYRRLTWVACHLVDAAREAIPGIERGAVLDGLVARCGEPHE